MIGTDQEGLVEWLQDAKDPRAQAVLRGPMSLDDATILALWMKGDAAAVAATMPPPLRPMRVYGGGFFLSVSHVRRASSVRDPLNRGFAYKELAVFVPALAPGRRPVLFCPVMYVDGMLAQWLGHTVFGIPKREANIDWNPRSFAVRERGVPRVCASWSRCEEQDAAEVASGLGNALWDSELPAWWPSLVGGLARTNHDGEGLRFWPPVPVVYRRSWDEPLLELPFHVGESAIEGVLDGPDVACHIPEWPSARCRMGLRMRLRTVFTRSELAFLGSRGTEGWGRFLREFGHRRSLLDAGRARRARRRASEPPSDA